MADTEPTVTITARELYALVVRVEDAAASVSNDVVTLGTTVGRIEAIAVDHEARIRELEKARDQGRRIDVLEKADDRHEAAFAKQGERIGALEAKEAGRPSLLTVASVVGGFLAIVVTIILFALNDTP